MPQPVNSILDFFAETLKAYILKLQGVEEAPPAPAAEKKAEETTTTSNDSDEPPFPPAYETGDDYEKASEFKMKAADLKSEGKWGEALECYTSAVLAAEPSALLYANRAMALMKLDRPKAAENDCSLALKLNPDSAKALRVRGKARKILGKYEEALKDLSTSQQIDFDESVVQDLKELSELHVEKEKEEAQKRNEEEEKRRKKAEEIKKAQEEAKKEADEQRAREAASGGRF